MSPFHRKEMMVLVLNHEWTGWRGPNCSFDRAKRRLSGADRVRSARICASKACSITLGVCVCYRRLQLRSRTAFPLQRKCPAPPPPGTSDLAPARDPLVTSHSDGPRESQGVAPGWLAAGSLRLVTVLLALGPFQAPN